jgi:acetamidase/formamidase
MDCAELVAGSVLLLPVAVAGGMISVGDGHAAQSDGELCGTAIECALREIVFTVRLHPGRRIAGPRVLSAPDAVGERCWMALGFGPTLDAAAEMAASGGLDLLEERLGLPRVRCAALASVLMDLRVTQMVNPTRGVHAVLRG